MSDRLEAALVELAAAIRDEVWANGHDAPERLLTVTEAAEAAGIGRSLLYRLIGQGKVRSIRLGSRRVVPASAISELAQAPPEGV